MTQNKNLKTRIRERMSLTGETYTTARKHVTAASKTFFESNPFPTLKNILVDESVIPKAINRMLSTGITLVSSSTGNGKTTFGIIAVNEINKKTAFIYNPNEKVEKFIEHPDNVTFFDVDDENTYDLEMLKQYDFIVWDELTSLDKNKNKLLKELSKTKPILLTVHAYDRVSAIYRLMNISTCNPTSFGTFDEEIVESVSGVIHLDRYRNIIPGINKTFCEVSEMNENLFNSAKVKTYNDIRKNMDESLDRNLKNDIVKNAAEELSSSVNKGLGEPRNRLQDEIQLLIEKGIVKEEIKQVSYYTMA